MTTVENGLPETVRERHEQLRRVLVSAVRSACPSWLAANSEDLVQEAMVRLWRGGFLDEGNGPPPSSYLWRVAHSVLVDEIRRRRRRRETSLEAEVETHEFASDAVGPDKAAAAREQAAAVRACLEELGEEARRAVGLRILGHGTGEIAAMLGWKYKKAENSVLRGLAALRRCLFRKGVRP